MVYWFFRLRFLLHCVSASECVRAEVCTDARGDGGVDFTNEWRVC